MDGSLLPCFFSSKTPWDDLPGQRRSENYFFEVLRPLRHFILLLTHRLWVRSSHKISSLQEQSLSRNRPVLEKCWLRAMRGDLSKCAQHCLKRCLIAISRTNSDSRRTDKAPATKCRHFWISLSLEIAPTSQDSIQISIYDHKASWRCPGPRKPLQCAWVDRLLSNQQRITQLTKSFSASACLHIVTWGSET